MHAGLAGQFLMKKFLHIPVSVEMASEFMYTDPVVDEKTLVIAVSQSGETIDTLEALKYAKQKGAGSLAVINVKGSSIARESDAVLYTNAGPEIAVRKYQGVHIPACAVCAFGGAHGVCERGFHGDRDERFCAGIKAGAGCHGESACGGKEKIRSYCRTHHQREGYFYDRKRTRSLPLRWRDL